MNMGNLVAVLNLRKFHAWERKRISSVPGLFVFQMDLMLSRTHQSTLNLIAGGGDFKEDWSYLWRFKGSPRGCAQKACLIEPIELAAEFGAGVPTVRDILDALQRPGRDPREDLPRPLLRRDVTHMEDLSEGMVLEGTVRNVVDFGAFVDIGVKHDGLVHISLLSDKFIKHPMEVVAVGDIVKVRVIGIDKERDRVSLSMRDLATTVRTA